MLIETFADQRECSIVRKRHPKKNKKYCKENHEFSSHYVKKSKTIISLFS